MGAVHELRESVAALVRDFSVDPDRVFLTGWSDGGFTALWLGSRYPHLVAGIAPYCANWQYTNVEQIGLYDVPTLAVDGWTDGGYNTSQFVRFHALHTMGYDIAGLWGHHGHSYKAYEDIEELRMILDWAKTKRRNLWPKRVRYATWNLTWHRAYWLSIERMTTALLPAQVDAEVRAGNRVEVKAWNVAAYRLLLGERLVDPGKPLTVVTNGATSYSGPFRKDLLVEVVKPPAGKFLKTPAAPGGITAQYDASTYGMRRGGGLIIADRRWLWVKPTGGDEKTRKLLAKWYPSWAKPDTDVTDEDIATRNLLLLGGPEVNRLTARVAADLPVKFARGRFVVGEDVYDQPTNCVKFIHPNPLNPRRYVMVHAFNDAEACARHRFFGLGKESAWKFRLGDCVVLGVPSRPGGWSVRMRAPAFEQVHYVFDSDWRPASDEPLGELAWPLDPVQVLRLRADAIRQAAGADAAIVSAYTPAYRRWRDSLPAGPVTLHDLATLDALPEYVMVGEVRGSTLASLARNAAASTILPDKRHPAYEPARFLLASEIDPDRTYRVAFSGGAPAYAAEYRKMPKLLFFKSPEEFLAGKHASLPVRRLRQIPVTVTEAVAEYIRERKRVSPRPACFDLAGYFVDPRHNEFGAYDWLNVGVDAPVRASGGGATERYVLSIALQPAGEPSSAPPRENSKAFLEPAATGRPATFDFARLGRHLNVSAEVALRPVAVAVGDDGFRLVGPDAQAALIGRGLVVTVRLRSRSEKDLVGLAGLRPGVLRRIHGSIWPDDRQGGKRTWYTGLYRSAGPYRKPPVRQDAALFLWPEGQARRLTRLSLKGAGYNFGLVAAYRPIRLPAGKTLTLPLLFLAVEKPAKVEKLDLAEMLEKIKPDLLASGG